MLTALPTTPDAGPRRAGDGGNVVELPQIPGTVAEGSAAPPCGARAGVMPAPIAADDWDDLFSAVKVRLRLSVGGLHTAAAAPQAAEAVRASVLDCVGALDQLHAALARDRAHRQRLEQDVIDGQASLALAITALGQARAEEQRARHLAQHDALTALPNRSGFHERAARVLADAGAQRGVLALLFLDLDDFKVINDRHGHATGDEVLRIAGQRIAHAVRAEDAVGRLGGDEFACLLGNAGDLQQLERRARLLADAVSAPMRIGHLALAVHPSIGIAMFPNDGTDAEALLRSADAAMFQAKRTPGVAACFASRGPAGTAAGAGARTTDAAARRARPR